MKRLIAIVIAAMMILTLVPVMAFSTSAAEEWNYPEPDKDSFWTTYRDIKEYNLAEGEPFKPTAGYKYDSEGFHTISPDYEGTTPKYTVSTSEPYDITEGFYMQLRVDEFSYDGGTNQDEWISFFISDLPTLSQGATNAGNNWVSLIRGKGDGNANVQSFITTADVEGKPGSFSHCGDVAVTIPLDNDNRETYEFAIVPNGENSYDITVNGVSVGKTKLAGGTGDDVSAAISSFEECYIGFTFHSNVEDGTAVATVLKQGTSKDTAAPITSGPAKEVEVSKVEYGDPIDPTTIPANSPALIFDGNLSSTYGEPAGSNCALSKNADGSYHVVATDTLPYFMWSIKYELTVQAEDFPVFGMMLKNYGGDDGGIFYAAGNVLGATNECTAKWSQWDLYETEDEEGNVIAPTAREYAHEEDTYVFVTIDLTDYNEWSGRIHSIRPDFNIPDVTDPEVAEFDIGFMGMFRSLDEAMAYSDKYITDKGGATVEQTTEAPKPDTEPAESTTESGSATEADTGKTTSATTSATEDEGCASVVGFASVAILSAAAAAVALKRKH